MKILWIASYPKSGNTWVRFLLASYLHGPIASSRDVARHIPDLHVPGEVDPARLAGGTDADVLPIKTHLACSDRHPAIERTMGFVYVLRDPRDVLLSNLNYHRLIGTRGSDGRPLDGALYAQAFVRAGGDPNWIERGFGTWAEHAASWVDLGARRWPHAVLRYEALRRDSAAGLREILGVLGQPVDEARLARAVTEASFDRMRALEVQEKAARAGSSVFAGDRTAMQKGRLFMNAGRSGQRLDTVAPGLDAAFDRAFGAPAARYGYGPA